MENKNVSRVLSVLAMVCLLVMCVGSAFAANQAPATISKHTITIDGSAISGATLTNGQWGIWKVMDQFDLGEGDDGALYQYNLTTNFAGFTSDKFDIDTTNGKIKTKVAVGELAADAVVNDTATYLGNDAAAQGKAASVLAKELLAYAKGNNKAPDATLSADNLVSGQLLDGYYLIAEVRKPNDNKLLATKPILLNLKSDATVTLKDAQVQLSKVITATNKEAGDYNIGDVVGFTLTTNFPTYAYVANVKTVKFVVTDTPSAGLTIDLDSVAVTFGGDTAAVTTDYTKALDAATGKLTITMVPQKVLDNAGEAVVITYNATVNSKAVINGENKNDAKVKFNRNPGYDAQGRPIDDDDDNPPDGDEPELEDEVKIYTYGTDVDKIDGAHASTNTALTPMAGAKFKLYAGEAPASLENFSGTALKLKAAVATDGAYSADKDVYIKDPDGTVEEVTTTTKEMCFAGLDAGKYFLVETAAPTGYAKLGAPIPFEVVALKADDTNAADGEQTGKSKVIVANDGYIELQKADKSASDGIMPADGTTGTVNMVIKNYEGVSLPGTGSITSLIIMGAGAAVAIGGGLFFGLKKKKDEEDE